MKDNPTATLARAAKHIVILVSPAGEEFFEAYGPMTKSREEATVFTTNALTLSRPSRLGGGPHRPFWDCEVEADRLAQKKYRGWSFRHESVPSSDGKCSAVVECTSK